MKFSQTVGLLALGASFVAALPKAQDPQDPGIVDLDPFADDPPVEEDPNPIDEPIEDDPFADDPIPEDPPVEGDPNDDPITGIPTDDPTDDDPITGNPDDVNGNGGGEIIQDPLPAECVNGCPTGYVLGVYYVEWCDCYHYGWHPTIQVDSQNDNSVDNSQYPDNSVDNSKFLSPDLNITDTDNSRDDSPDVGNGNGNGNGGNGNGNGANVTQNNAQNVAVAVDAAPHINIYNSDGSINEAAVVEAQKDHQEHHDWYPKNGTYTEIVTVLTTYCSEAMTITQNGIEHPVTAAGYVTITDCPCTVVHDMSKPTTMPAPAPAPASPDVIAVAGNNGASADAGSASADAGSAGVASPPVVVDTGANSGASASAGTVTADSAPAQYTGAASLGMAVNWVLAAFGVVVVLL